jgi:hypothetical protein
MASPFVREAGCASTAFLFLPLVFLRAKMHEWNFKFQIKNFSFTTSKFHLSTATFTNPMTRKK